MRIERRFPIPGSSYDYIKIEEEGDSPLGILKDIWKAYYTELALMNKLQSNEFDILKVHKAIEDAVNNITADLLEDIDVSEFDE